MTGNRPPTDAPPAQAVEPPRPGPDWCERPRRIAERPIGLRERRVWWIGCGMCEPCYRRRTMTGSKDEPKR